MHLAPRRVQRPCHRTSFGNTRRCSLQQSRGGYQQVSSCENSMFPTLVANPHNRRMNQPLAFSGFPEASNDEAMVLDTEGIKRCPAISEDQASPRPARSVPRFSAQRPTLTHLGPARPAMTADVRVNLVSSYCRFHTGSTLFAQTS